MKGACHLRGQCSPPDTENMAVHVKGEDYQGIEYGVSDTRRL